MTHTRRPVRFFVSYADRDAKRKDDLLAALRPILAASRTYDYRLWHDGDILIGEKWRDEIDRALGECDFGLLLVSPSFLTSRFITAVELPRFVGPSTAKPVLPVALGRLVIDRMDLKGLSAHQIFFHKDRCFAQYATTVAREDFATELFLGIEKRLDSHFAPGAGRTRAARRVGP